MLLLSGGMVVVEQVCRHAYMSLICKNSRVCCLTCLLLLQHTLQWWTAKKQRPRMDLSRGSLSSRCLCLHEHKLCGVLGGGGGR